MTDTLKVLEKMAMGTAAIITSSLCHRSLFLKYANMVPTVKNDISELRPLQASATKRALLGSCKIFPWSSTGIPKNCKNCGRPAGDEKLHGKSDFLENNGGKRNHEDKKQERKSNRPQMPFSKEKKSDPCDYDQKR